MGRCRVRFWLGSEGLMGGWSCFVGGGKLVQVGFGLRGGFVL